MKNLLQVSALQSRRDEGKCPVPPKGSHPDHAEAQLEAVQGALRQQEAEVRGATQGVPLRLCLPGPSCLCAGCPCDTVCGLVPTGFAS